MQINHGDGLVCVALLYKPRTWNELQDHQSLLDAQSAPLILRRHTPEYQQLAPNPVKQQNGSADLKRLPQIFH